MDLTPAELAARPQQTVLVDIRRPEEWRQTGLIEGAHPLTFFDANGQADPPAWLAALATLASPEDDLVLICRSGARTEAILNFLHAQTPYRQAQHLAGGMLAWLEQGKPVVAL